MILSTTDHSILYQHTSLRAMNYLIIYVDDIVITKVKHLKTKTTPLQPHSDEELEESK